MNELSTQVEKLDEVITRQNGELVSLREENEGLRRESDNFEEIVQRIHADYQAQFRQYQLLNSKINGGTPTASSSKKFFEDQIALLLREQERLHKVIADKNAECDALAQQVAELCRTRQVPDEFVRLKNENLFLQQQVCFLQDLHSKQPGPEKQPEKQRTETTTNEPKPLKLDAQLRAQIAQCIEVVQRDARDPVKLTQENTKLNEQLKHLADEYEYLRTQLEEATKELSAMSEQVAHTSPPYSPRKTSWSHC